MKKKRIFQRGILLIVLLVTALVYFYPVYLMFINSLKSFGEILTNPISWPKEFVFQNYADVFKKMNYLKLFRNNVIITVTGLVGIVFFGSMAAYILDRRRTRYTKLAYFLIITPMLIPFQTIMITLLKAMSVIHLS